VTAPQSTTRSHEVQRPVLVAAVLCLLSFTAFWIAQNAAHVSMIDAMVYRAEGWAVRTGADLYELRATHAQLPNTYPPFAALVFTPLTLVGAATMRMLTRLTNLGLLVAFIHLSLRLLGRPLTLPRPAAVLAIAAAAVWCEPVWTTLRYGQVNLFLAVLVLWDLTRRPGHRWAGIGIGVAAGMKLTPALFAVFLALAGAVLAWRRTRQGAGAWNPVLRRALVAVTAFAGTVAVTAVVLPRDSWTYWTQVLFATGRPGHVEDTANQSLRGVLARVLHSGEPAGWWLLPATVVACAGLAVAVAALLAGERRLPHANAWAAVSCAVTALLVSPISWSHHWVWAVPMVLLLAVEAMLRRSTPWTVGGVLAGLVFCSYALWMVPHGVTRPELHQSVGRMALSAIYPLTGAVFLAVAGTVTLRALRSAAPRCAEARGDTDDAARAFCEHTSPIDCVELRGFEPLTSCMPCKRSTN
jgi:hypothetical protein